MWIQTSHLHESIPSLIFLYHPKATPPRCIHSFTNVRTIAHRRPRLAGLNADAYSDFTTETNQTIKLPRPPELPSDVLLSPFFLPAMNDSALCLAVLAASAADLPQRSGRAAENVTVLTLFDKAMYQLRERLNSGPVRDATVAAATFLWAINSLLNDADSMRLHGKSVHALVSRRGGLENLGLNGAVAQLVMMVDHLNAIIFGEKTSYPYKFDTPPLESEPAAICGAYFTSPRAQRSIDPALSKLCLESVGVANLLERMINTRSTTPEYFHAMSKLSTIGSDTTNMYVRFRGTGSMDECVCLAMQLTSIVLYYQPREQQMMVIRQASRLIRALHKQEIPSYWVIEMELLVWILFVVAMIPHEFEGKEWAMDLLCQGLCSKLGAEEWPDDWEDTVRRVVLKFIWCDARLAPVFATICRSIALRVFGEHEDSI
jgi:hypothetical protein